MVSGNKASGHFAQSECVGDGHPGRAYENVEMVKRPFAEDDKQVVDMNIKHTQKRDN